MERIVRMGDGKCEISRGKENGDEGIGKEKRGGGVNWEIIEEENRRRQREKKWERIEV